MSTRTRLTGMTLAEEKRQQVGVTEPGWPCPVCGKQNRSQVFRREHVKKVHPFSFHKHFPAPPPDYFLLTEGECLEADPHVELRLVVDKKRMRTVPEHVKLTMDDSKTYLGRVIDSTEGYEEFDLTVMVEEVQ